MKKTGLFKPPCGLMTTGRWAVAFLFATIALLNFLTGDDGQYRKLAVAFLQGQLSLPVDATDGSPFEGLYYSPIGPLPAIVFLPLVWAGWFHIGALSFLISLGVFYLCYRLARRFDYSTTNATWLAVAFCFGSSFLGTAALASSNHFAHVMAVFFLFLAIDQHEKRRAWLVGAFLALAMGCRPPIALNILIFIALACLGSETIRMKAASLTRLLFPYGAGVVLLAAYNYARFGNPMEFGYTYQLNGYGNPYSEWVVPGNNGGPPLSISNLPGHLMTFLFGLPDFRAVGTSVLLVSPWLVYLSRAHWDLTAKVIAIDVVVVMLTVLSFRSTGFEQMGYRFSLDFLPFVFWLLVRSRVTLTPIFKGIILATVLLDVLLTGYLLYTGVDRRAADLAASHSSYRKRIYVFPRNVWSIEADSENRASVLYV